MISETAVVLSFCITCIVELDLVRLVLGGDRGVMILGAPCSVAESRTEFCQVLVSVTRKVSLTSDIVSHSRCTL